MNGPACVFWNDIPVCGKIYFPAHIPAGLNLWLHPPGRCAQAVLSNPDKKRYHKQSNNRRVL